MTFVERIKAMSKLSKIGVTSAALLLTISGLSSVRAEPFDYYLMPDTVYDVSVLKPAEVFGHEVGDQPVRHDLFVDYMRRLADASPRMIVETIGYSHEKRPILFFTITSPENHQRLTEIRENHLKRTNPETQAEASDEMPLVTWLNYGVHGAEASGMDAAIPFLYHMAAATGPDVDKILDDSVIVVTALFNPDGHSRRASWVTSYGSKHRATDPLHAIHNQAWPGSRTNHYWFDLNRQWLLQTQPESRAWLKKWHEWKPQITGDFHEMGTNSTYYFHPGVPTRIYPMIPAQGRKLAVELAGYHASALDKDKELYFSEEGFDNYYIGKGSTYPQVNGGLGILYEAGAQMGIAKESNQGIKTYANNIRNHFRASIGTITGGVNLREKLHAYQRKFFKDSVKKAKEDPVKAYAFRLHEDPVRLQKFIDLLNRHDIRVHKIQGKVRLKVRGLDEDGKTVMQDRTFGDKAYIVDLNQKQYVLAKALFNQITSFPDKVFYDVSGWTLPLAYGLEYGEVRKKIRSHIGAPVLASFKSTAVPPQAPYAYVFDWAHYYAPRAVNRLLQEGVLVRVGKTPYSVRALSQDGQTIKTVAVPRGSVIVPLDNQTVGEGEIYDLIRQAAVEDSIPVHSVVSGHTPEAGSDLGGRDSVADLKAPHALMITDWPASPYDAGEVWHQLDHRMDMPITLVRGQNVSAIDWSRYTHLVLVGGYGSRYSRDDKLTKSIHSWVRGGGTLIATRGAAAWVAKEIVPDHDDKAKAVKTKKTKKSEATSRLAYAGKNQKDAEHVIGGALFESKLDITHPMAFGYYRPLVATNRNTSLKLPIPKDPYARVAVYSDTPLLSGYASDKRLSELKGTPMMTAERIGSGAVILFVDNPNFRATYLGVEKLFMNAFFLSKAFNRANLEEDSAENIDMHEE